MVVGGGYNEASKKDGEGCLDWNTMGNPLREKTHQFVLYDFLVTLIQLVFETMNPHSRVVGKILKLRQIHFSTSVHT